MEIGQNKKERTRKVFCYIKKKSPPNQKNKRFLGHLPCFSESLLPDEFAGRDMARQELREPGQHPGTAA